MSEEVIQDVEAEPEEEGVHFLTNGKVKLWFEDTTGEEPKRLAWLLRMPKLGEYRRFRDMMFNAPDSTMGASVDEQYNIMADWCREVFKTLQPNVPLPDDHDTWPTWLVSGFLQGALIRHWTTIPLVRGVKGTAPTTVSNLLSLPNL